MDPLSSHHLQSISNNINRASHIFQLEECREIRLWNKYHKDRLDEILNDSSYCYRGRFVQTIRRDKGVEEQAADEEQELDEDESQRRKSKKSKKAKKVQKQETTLQPGVRSPPELMFVGLYTQIFYNYKGEIKSKYRKKVMDMSDSENEADLMSESSKPAVKTQIPNAVESVHDDQIPNRLESSHKQLSSHKYHKNPKTIKHMRQELDIETRIMNICRDPERFEKDALTTFQKTVFGLEKYPQPLKVGKVQKETARTKLLLSTLSPSTQHFLAKRSCRKGSCKNFSEEDTHKKKAHGRSHLSSSDLVSVRFYDYTKAHLNQSSSDNGFNTSKTMVSTILFRSFLEGKYELARQALAVYIRTPDPDLRFVYTIVLRILQERVGSSLSFSQNDAEKDSEFMRWMCVAYPSVHEARASEKVKRTAKSVDFYGLTLLQMMLTGSAKGYRDALEMLQDLIVKPPYVDEPIFYLLRATANCMLACDEGDLRERINAVDKVYNDFERIKELEKRNSSSFYPQALAEQLLEKLESLQDNLQTGQD